MLRVDDQEIDRSDVAARPDRRPKGEDGAADHLASRFRDEDARLRQVNQLPKEVRGVHGALATVFPKGGAAERHEPIDVRDSSRPDQVFHAGGYPSLRVANVPAVIPDRWDGE